MSILAQHIHECLKSHFTAKAASNDTSIRGHICGWSPSLRRCVCCFHVILVKYSRCCGRISPARTASNIFTYYNYIYIYTGDVWIHIGLSPCFGDDGDRMGDAINLTVRMTPCQEEGIDGRHCCDRPKRFQVSSAYLNKKT